MAFDFKAAAGEGMGDFDRSILGLPFIGIIQKSSPEFDGTHKDFATKEIKGCKPGNILFAPEHRVLSAPLEVIPLAQRTLYTEWKPRKGGFAGNRDLTIVDHPNYKRGTPGSKEQNKEWLGENELIRTIYYAVVFKDNDEWKQGLIGFTSSGLKPARLWGKAIINVRFEGHPTDQPPIYSAIWNVGTKVETDAEGNGWFNWDIRIAKVLDPEKDEALLKAGQTLRTEVERKLLPSPKAQQVLTAGTVTVEDGPF